MRFFLVVAAATLLSCQPRSQTAERLPVHSEPAQIAEGVEAEPEEPAAEPAKRDETIDMFPDAGEGYPMVTGPKAADNARALHPAVLTCANDSDCELSKKSFREDWLCCNSCGERAANAEWLQQFDAACAAVGDERGPCPRFKCRKQLPHVAKCVSGACQAIEVDE